ncbi:hypothetical protein [Thioclava sp. GXIMD4215]|uniref:hypothetical protein n=1 Tax=Thioclava sp. GXIMD4215 TaxID=3131928 RepID=UPI00311AE6C9
MKRRYIVITCLGLAGGSAGFLFWSAVENNKIRTMTLSFGADSTSPAVVTHFAIESPITPVEPFIAHGMADISMPRSSSANVLGVPVDAKHDGIWQVSAQWVELPTNITWTATVDVPVKDLTIAYHAYELTVLFGPNGALTIASDKIGTELSDRLDVAFVCATMGAPPERVWKEAVNYFPALPVYMKFSPEAYQAARRSPRCPAPTGPSEEGE